jgi:hypothetical protein
VTQDGCVFAAFGNRTIIRKPDRGVPYR